MEGTNEVKGEVLASIAGTWLGRVDIGEKTCVLFGITAAQDQKQKKKKN
jgi:hypothetical protein